MSLVISRSSTWNKLFHFKRQIWTRSVALMWFEPERWWNVKMQTGEANIAKRTKMFIAVYISCGFNHQWKKKKKRDPKTHESTSAQFSRDEVILVKSLHFLFSHCSCVTLSDLCAMESTSMEAGTASEQITLIWNQFASAMPLGLCSQAAHFIHPSRKTVKFR